ncbi:hypothetical protein [Litorisediminicola beolgyonensis]|uniref:Chromosome partition protein Smc n=1 Tax=Litorisediminicola beolgyonensis TaxID=1173614 RepID=A0ABW3ZMT5_9RHOB
MTAIWHDHSPSARALAEKAKAASVRIVSTDEVGPFLAADKSARVLALYDPASLLAETIAQEGSLDEAVQNWTQRIRALLEVQRRNRRQCALRSVAGMHTGLKDALRDVSLPEAAVESAALPEMDPVLILLGQAALKLDATASALLTEIEAGDPSAGQESPSAFLETALEELRNRQHAEQDRAEQDRRELEQAQNRLAEAEAQLDNYTKQLNDLDAHARDERDRLTRQVSDISGERDLLQRQIAVMGEELTTFETQHETLQQRVSQMSEGLKSYEAQLAALQQETALKADKLALKNDHLAALAAEAHGLREDLARVRNSRSYRLMAPLRGVGRLLRGSRND